MFISLIGKRVEMAPHTDRWMKGDRFATILSNEGTSGIALLYRLKFDRSGEEKVYADTYFRPLY